MNALTSRLSRMKRSALVWRWIRNFDRTLRFRLDDGVGQGMKVEVAAFRTEGIMVRHAEAIFDQGGLALLDKIISILSDKMGEGEIQDVLRRRHSGSDRKEFYRHLLGKEFEGESPFIQLAIQPRLLTLVNGYMGMWSYLRSVDVWLNFPTSGAATETQLWHRDADDFMNVKVLIYLNDVDEETGPFCFIPGTHPPHTGRSARALRRP